MKSVKTLFAFTAAAILTAPTVQAEETPSRILACAGQVGCVRDCIRPDLCSDIILMTPETLQYYYYKFYIEDCNGMWFGGEKRRTVCTMSHLGYLFNTTCVAYASTNTFWCKPQDSGR